MSAIVSKKPIRQIAQVQELLANENARDQLAAVAAKHLNPERMMRVVANAIRTTPKLRECEPMSFLGAMMQCASLGLEPNTVLGHAYLIPFDKKEKDKATNQWKTVRTDVQVVIGYKGLIDLARRSGHITSLAANVHYEDDELWDYEEGTESRLRHRPGAQEGKKLHAYAIAKFKDGGHAYVVLPWSHVLKIRDGSQGWQTAKRYNKTAESPWGKYEDEMAKKTAIRALAKYLPLSVEFMDALSVDEGRVDYAAFAADPDTGIAPSQEEYIEGEAEEQEDEPQRAAQQSEPDQERTTPKAQEKQAEKPAETEKRTAQSTPDQETTNGQLPLDGAEASQPEIDAERFEELVAMILDDLQDSSADEVEQMYGPQIEKMRSTRGLESLAKRVTDAIAKKRT